MSPSPSMSSSMSSFGAPRCRRFAGASASASASASAWAAVPALPAVPVMLFALGVSSACVSRAFHNDEGAQAQVVGGTPVAPGDFPGLLYSSTMACTATKIGPRHVLTARHCRPGIAVGTSLAIEGWDPGSRRVVSTSVAVTKVTSHGDTNSLRNVDIAVIEVAAGDPVFAKFTTAPLSTGSAVDGLRVTMVGFGCTARKSVPTDGSADGGGFAVSTGVDKTSVQTSSSTPSQAKQQVSPLTPARQATRISCGLKIFGTQHPARETNVMCQFPVTAGQPELTAGLCPGDSGGPLYVNLGTSRTPAWKLVGVSSNVNPHSGESRFVRVDVGARALNDWVKNASSSLAGTLQPSSTPP
jgi:secreted trypsin-like serine protease